MTSRPNMLDIEAMSSMTFATVGLLLHRLLAKEVLSKQEVNQIFDSVLGPYEAPQLANDPVALRIRKLADEMAHLILETGKPK